MIVKQEWRQSNAQQNIVQPQNPTMGVTINNESTATEPPSWNRQFSLIYTLSRHKTLATKVQKKNCVGFSYF